MTEESAAASSTENWVRWVIGILVGTLLGMSGYTYKRLGEMDARITRLLTRPQAEITRADIDQFVARLSNNQLLTMRAEGTHSWRPLSLSPWRHEVVRSLVQELCRRTLLHHHLHASLSSHDRDRYVPPLVPGEQQVDARLAYA